MEDHDDSKKMITADEMINTYKKNNKNNKINQLAKCDESFNNFVALLGDQTLDITNRILNYIRRTGKNHVKIYSTELIKITRHRSNVIRLSDLNDNLANYDTYNLIKNIFYKDMEPIEILNNMKRNKLKYNHNFKGGPFTGWTLRWEMEKHNNYTVATMKIMIRKTRWYDFD